MYQVPEDKPDKMQQVTPLDLQLQSFHKLVEMEQTLKELKEAISALSNTLALHVKQNIDTFHSMNEYIGEQMSYRLFRQGMEENNLSLELAKRNLELEYLEKQVKAVEQEKEEESTQAERLHLEVERQKLEIENLRKNIDILENVRKSTKDKIQPVKVEDPFARKMRETLVLTVIGTTTAATVGGIIAFILWLVRLYLQSAP